jgi:large subunit ribosomal protein L22
MPKVGYSNPNDTDYTARAIGREKKVSPKHCMEICSAIRGMEVTKAKAYLIEVIALRKPIKYRRYNRFTSHKRGIGPGRFPQKACRAVLETIKNAQANADHNKNLDPDDMRIITAAAHLGRKIPGFIARAHGSSSPMDERTVNIEIVLESLDKEEAE